MVKNDFLNVKLVRRKAGRQEGRQEGRSERDMGYRISKTHFFLRKHNSYSLCHILSYLTYLINIQF